MGYPVVFAAGGTGGHIFPAIALAQQLKAQTGWDVAFIGTPDRMEARLIPQYGYEFFPVKMSGLQRKLSLKNLLLPFNLLHGVMQIRPQLRQWDTKIVVGMAAYISVPPVLAARSLGLPTVICEQDRFPGVATRMLCKRAKRIYFAYDEAINRLPPLKAERTMVTGNPLRPELFQWTRESARQKYGLKDTDKVILVVGGSSGAHSINESVRQIIDRFYDCHFLWQTGEQEFANLYQNYRRDNIRFMSFIEDIGAAYMAADIVISRSGAIAIAELTALGCAAILIPYPHATGDHQTLNAVALEQVEAAIIIKDNGDLTPTLAEKLSQLISEPERIKTMASIAKSFGKPDATKVIVDDIIKLIAN